MRPEIREQLRKSAAETYRRQLQRHLRLRKRRKVSEWAEAERWIARGASPLSVEGDIPYRLNVTPWAREPMDSATDPAVQVTVLWWASGLAKTEVAVNIMGHSIAEEPKNIFVAYPKDDSRDKFSRDVLQRSLIDATPSIRDLVSEFKSRDGGNTIAYKRYVGGSIFMVGAGSAANFRGPRAGMVYCDEIDGMPDDVDGEGDPIFLAFKRAEGFAQAIKLLSGTGTLKAKLDKDGKKIYRSRIEQWFDLSDKRKWFCPCRACGYFQVLSLDRVKTLTGRHEDAFYLCSQCDADHSDKQRVRMVLDGEWRATAPFSGVRGYWLNGVNSTLPAEKGFSSKMHQFLSDAARAETSPTTKRVFINTFLAELDDPDEQAEPPIDPNPLLERREAYTLIPRQALVLTAAADVQMDRLEVMWVAWARGEESWVMRHQVLYGPTQEDRVWRDLETELLRRFENEDGVSIDLSMAFVDAGKWPDRVYAFLTRLRDTGSPLAGRVRASRGSSQFPHPVVDPRHVRIIKNVFGHWIGPDAAKDCLYSRLRRPVPTDGPLPEAWQHFPATVGENFFAQLTAEQANVKFERGEEVRRYVNPGKRRNEILDLSVYNLAAFRVRKWPFQAIEAELLAKAEEAKGEAPAPAPMYAPRGGFAMRW